MAVEDWIDSICDLAGEVNDLVHPPVKSYSCYEGTFVPDTLNQFPCALTYVENLTPLYSQSVSIDIWQGVTEFHLFPNKSMSNYPAAVKFFALIRDAFAAHMTLGGLVAYCQLKQDETGLSLAVFNPASADAHLGIMARWIVKENLTVTIGL